jgi:hypothetical protein
MPASVFGVPTHPLIVHATVVLVPLAAVLLILAIAWPRLRRRLGPLPALAAAVSLVLVPVTTSSGEALEKRLPSNPLIERHVQLGDQLLPWVLGLLVAALVLLWADGWRPRTGVPALAADPGVDAPIQTARPLAIRVVVAVLVLVAATGTIVQVIRIGHAGAKASWAGVAAAHPDLGGPVVIG